MKKISNAWALLRYDAFTQEYSIQFVSKSRDRVKAALSKEKEVNSQEEIRGMDYDILPTYVE